MAVFTVSSKPVSLADDVAAGPLPKPPNDLSYDVAVVRFEDSGRAHDHQELAAATQSITHARSSNPNGAIVVVFIHGWHHNADWDVSLGTGDAHFRSFRTLLKSLAAREAERYTPSGLAGRRVVGVYVGWNGDPHGSALTALGLLSNLSFWNRGKTAETIGAGNDLRQALGSLIAATKDPLGSVGAAQPAESPLVLIGHSMGALILESAFLALITDPSRPLLRPSNDAPRPVETRAGSLRLAFPDVLLALNSAADSDIFRRIRDALRDQQFSKSLAAGGVKYAPPLLISATSVADTDTGVIWPLASGPWAGRKTDGHDSSLFTHDFQLDSPSVQCQRRGSIDFGQTWHCLRPPQHASVPTPVFPIDLPTQERKGIADTLVGHARYVLTPRQPAQAHLGWVFQLPKEVSKEHNDIFNFKAASLMLGLIQISGAVMSLAQDLDHNFEPL